MDSGCIDFFSSGISILYNEPELTTGDSGQTHEVQFEGLPKFILQIPDTPPKNVFLFAHHLWKGCVLLSRLIMDQKYCAIRQKTCLELGAGAGLCGIVANVIGAKFVVSSDYPEPFILDKLHRNMEKNCINTNWQVNGHLWGTHSFVKSPILSKFDVILMSDTLWMSDQHSNLLNSINLFLENEGVVLGVAGFHTGLDVIESFIEMARQAGFIAQIMDYVHVPIGNGLCENMEWLIAKKENVSREIDDRKRFMVVYTLRKGKRSQETNEQIAKPNHH